MHWWCGRSNGAWMSKAGWGGGLAFLLMALAVPALGDDFGLRLPPGFQVSLYADETLANDTYAMTLDARGRVVVTSQGSVKILHDSTGSGRADRATVYTTTATGGMGLCCDGDDLFFCGDGWFSRYRGRPGSEQAEGAPEHIVPLVFTEHGGHAMRKGPDGFWYVIGGNDSKIGRGHVNTPDSPVREPVAGALLRISPDLQRHEVFAHGFRNPYDFDFNSAGDLFTYDSDVERVYFLPWYTPTRMFHIAQGGHHGWRVTGYLRSWARPDYSPDTVDILWPVGRGSPTGVVCYRHNQFPAAYHGAVFALDWTFGKVFVFRLEPDGSTYRTQGEVFLEPVGTNGFAPTDAAVAPDGSLLISIGGRHTRGSVFRVSYVGDGKESPEKLGEPTSDLARVLQAPQPLDAWSRTRWMPLARSLGAEPFVRAVGDEALRVWDRVRAVEILTELFGGLPTASVRSALDTAEPLVRARVAWSLGRVAQGDPRVWLGQLGRDRDPRVKLAALDALAEQPARSAKESDLSLIRMRLGDTDKRVRQAAARLAVRLPDFEWARIWGERAKLTPQAQLTAALASAWRMPRPAVSEAVIDTVLNALGQADDRSLRLQAVRLLILGLGDIHLDDPPVEAFTGYSPQLSLEGHEAVVARILQAVRPLFPAGEEPLDLETARLLAILEDADPAVPARVAAKWTDRSSPTSDMHYLIVFTRLRGPHDAALTGRVARTFLGLHAKLRGQEQRDKQVWNERIGEVVQQLLQHDPRLADALLDDPHLVDPAHVALAASLDPPHRRQAARKFQEAARADADFAWSVPLVELLADLPTDQVRPLLRSQWSHFGLREAIVLQLAQRPEEVDRGKFLDVLDSPLPNVTSAALGALAELPRDPDPEHLVPLFQLLRRLVAEPKTGSLRREVAALIDRQAGRALLNTDPERDPAHLRQGYQPYFDWLARTYPQAARQLEGSESEALATWLATLKQVDWPQGDAVKGGVLFRDRACQTCHGGSSRIGPDLTGVTRRFSRADLFTAIVAPSRDIAPAYRPTLVETRDGELFAGIVVFLSADGLIVQTGATTTVRIDSAQIADQRPSPRSLMPDGLLNGLAPRDLADLYAYLRTLEPRKTGDPGSRAAR